MSSNDLKAEAVAAWRDYGEALVSAFRFPVGNKIDEGVLTEIIRQGDDASLKAFIAYARQQAVDVRKMKFVGEK